MNTMDRHHHYEVSFAEGNVRVTPAGPKRLWFAPVANITFVCLFFFTMGFDSHTIVMRGFRENLAIVSAFLLAAPIWGAATKWMVARHRLTFTRLTLYVSTGMTRGIAIPLSSLISATIEGNHIVIEHGNGIEVSVVSLGRSHDRQALLWLVEFIRFVHTIEGGDGAAMQTESVLPPELRTKILDELVKGPINGRRDRDWSGQR